MQTSCNFVLVQHRHLVSDFEETTVSPRGRRDDMPPRRWQFDPKIVADLRPSADESAVHTSLVAGGG